MTIPVAFITYTDTTVPDEMRGYQDVSFADAGVVHFTWHEAFLTIPLHRVKSISQRVEAEPVKECEGQR